MNELIPIQPIIIEYPEPILTDIADMIDGILYKRQCTGTSQPTIAIPTPISDDI